MSVSRTTPGALMNGARHALDHWRICLQVIVRPVHPFYNATLLTIGIYLGIIDPVYGPSDLQRLNYGHEMPPPVIHQTVPVPPSLCGTGALTLRRLSRVYDLN